MEAQELRVGNSILVDGQVVVVGWITIRACEMGYTIGNPIPLTEDWLLRLGFKKIESIILEAYEIVLPSIGNKVLSVTIQHGNQYIYIKDFDTDDFKQIPNDLVCLRNSDSHGEFFVHQLQNLYFCLTNQELTIHETTKEPKETT